MTLTRLIKKENIVYAKWHSYVNAMECVYKVLLDAAQLTTLKCELEKIIEPDVDSIRIYRLGNSYKNKIEVMGKTSVLQAGEPLLL